MADTIESLLKLDAESVQATRRKQIEGMKKITYSPVEAQIAFLKELSRDPVESEKFMKSPVEYAKAHGIVLDREVVKDITDSIYYDVEITDPVKERLGVNGLKDLVDMRKDAVTGTNANAAVAVAAGAAVVAALCAVVTAVVTLTRTSKVNTDLKHIKDIKGTIRLPKGAVFKARDINKR